MLNEFASLSLTRIFVAVHCCRHFPFVLATTVLNLSNSPLTICLMKTFTQNAQKLRCTDRPDNSVCALPKNKNLTWRVKLLTKYSRDKSHNRSALERKLRKKEKAEESALNATNRSHNIQYFHAFFLCQLKGVEYKLRNRVVYRVTLHYHV